MAIPAAKNGLALTNACNWGIYMGFTFRASPCGLALGLLVRVRVRVRVLVLCCSYRLQLLATLGVLLTNCLPNVAYHCTPAYKWGVPVCRLPCRPQLP